MTRKRNALLLSLLLLLVPQVAIAQENLFSINGYKIRIDAVKIATSHDGLVPYNPDAKPENDRVLIVQLVVVEGDVNEFDKLDMWIVDKNGVRNVKADMAATSKGDRKTLLFNVPGTTRTVKFYVAGKGMDLSKYLSAAPTPTVAQGKAEDARGTAMGATAYLKSGVAHAARREYARAIDDYSKAIALDPTLAIAYHNRGIAHGETGQYDRAIEDYDKAIALDPKLVQSYVMRGATYSMKGQQGRAIEDCSKAIGLNPNLAEAYTTRGAAYADDGQTERARSDFQRACDMGNDKGCRLLQLLSQERRR